MNSRNQSVDAVLGCIPLLLGIELLIWVIFLPLALSGRADFRQLYSGGYMIRSGDSCRLYDYEAQKSAQNRVVSVAGTALPVNHLAYEELLFVPLSLFSYRSAYFIFLALNVALLFWIVWTLQPVLPKFRERWKWLPAFLACSFMPISVAMMQGQDSIILLGLLVGAYLTFERSESTAGALVGLGLFKFQITIPIALLFMIWKRWKFMLGFLTTSAAVLLLSLVIVGPNGMIAYIHTLTQMSAGLRTASDQLHFATNPGAMPNLRGLLSGSGLLPGLARLITIVATMLIIALAWRSKPGFALAVTVASLISYHLLIHDLSILLLPVYLVLEKSNFASARWSAVAVFFTPSMIACLPQYSFLGAIPILVFLVSLIRANSTNLLSADSIQ